MEAIFAWFGGLFILGSFMFYGLTMLGLFLWCWAVEEDEFGLATFCLVVYLGLIHGLGNASVGSYIMANPWCIAKWAAVYVVAAIAWSFAKMAIKIKSAKLNGRDVPSLNSIKKQIPIWMAYWPASMLSTLFGNILRDGWKWIASKFGTAYDKLYHAMVK